MPPTWRTHELVTKAIFEALLKQSDPEQWDIKHDTTLVGLKTCHQIDVYWKFRMAGLEHFVIVQVKKKKERAKQGDILLFSAVLNDIPGQPRGVFISQTGYQKGALKVARNSGIAALELRKIDQITPSAVTMTSWSVGILAPRKDIMAWEITILQPTIENIMFSLDKEWVEQHYPETRPLTPKPAQEINAAKFVDGSGNLRTSIRNLVQDLVRKFNDAGRTQLDFRFPEPTYLTGIDSENNAGASVDNLKIVNVTATVDIIKRTTTFPMFSHSTATYLLKNAIEENDHRYALIAEHGPELKAQVSLHPGVLTVSQVATPP